MWHKYTTLSAGGGGGEDSENDECVNKKRTILGVVPNLNKITIIK